MAPAKSMHRGCSDFTPKCTPNPISTDMVGPSDENGGDVGCSTRAPMTKYKRNRRSSEQGTTNGKRARLSSRIKVSYLCNITTKLSPANNNVLVESCFGQLFDIKEYKFQGQVIHLIRCLEPWSEERSTLVFRINGSLIEFGPTEFALMTGLSFLPNEDPLPTTSDAHANLFNSKESIPVDDIWLKFVKESDANNNSTASLQLPSLFIVYSVLKMKKSASRAINMRYFHLIYDLSKFYSYPWGRVAYDVLVHTLHKARTSLISTGSSSKCKRESCEVDGFVYALQTWAYEVVPGLATYVAYRIKDADDLVPRTTRWKAQAQHIFRFDDLVRFFQPSSGSEPVPMVPSELELQKLSSLGVSYKPGQVDAAAECKRKAPPHDNASKGKRELGEKSGVVKDNDGIPRRSSKNKGKDESPDAEIGKQDGACACGNKAMMAELRFELRGMRMDYNRGIDSIEAGLSEFNRMLLDAKHDHGNPVGGTSGVSRSNLKESEHHGADVDTSNDRQCSPFWDAFSGDAYFEPLRREARPLSMLSFHESLLEPAK